MKNLTFSLLPFLLLLLHFTPAHAQLPGQLDSSFGEAGKIALNFEEYAEGLDLLMKSDGSIVASMTYQVFPTNYALAKFSNDGTLDQSFGVNGIFKSEISISGDVRIEEQSDGKVMVLTKKSGFPNLTYLFRHLENGTVDLSFGDQGRLDISYMGHSTDAQAISVLPDNSIVIAGNINESGMSPKQFILKLTADGAIDPSFGMNGYSISSLSELDRCFDMIATETGTIYTCGEDSEAVSFGTFNVMKYLPNGELDTNFGEGGYYRNSDFNAGVALAIQSDGKIVATTVGVDQSNFQFAVLRLNLDGSVDDTFGNAGIALSTSAIGANPFGIAVDSKDRVLVAGQSPFVITDSKVLLSRFDQNGTLDNAFGTAGMTSTVFDPAANETALNVGIQADDKIITIGRSDTQTGPTSVVLARFLAEITSSVSFQNERLISKIHVAPNPFIDNVSIEFSLAKKEMITIALVDSQGREVYVLQKNKWLNEGKNKKTFQIPDSLPPGNYFITLSNDTQTFGAAPVVIGY